MIFRIGSIFTIAVDVRAIVILTFLNHIWVLSSQSLQLSFVKHLFYEFYFFSIGFIEIEK